MTPLPRTRDDDPDALSTMIVHAEKHHRRRRDMQRRRVIAVCEQIRGAEKGGAVMDLETLRRAHALMTALINVHVWREQFEESAEHVEIDFGMLPRGLALEIAKWVEERAAEELKTLGTAKDAA
jgi:hypothetical protein